jgi:hypothetical protein
MSNKVIERKLKITNKKIFVSNLFRKIQVDKNNFVRNNSKALIK